MEKPGLMHGSIGGKPFEVVKPWNRAELLPPIFASLSNQIAGLGVEHLSSNELPLWYIPLHKFEATFSGIMG